ncbi:MAG: tol-pal system protein YbgF [Hyphomicrobiales bacterium]
MSSHEYWKPIILTVMVLASAAGCATRRDVTTIDSRLSEIEMRDAEDRRRRDEISKSRETNEQALRQMSASLRAQIDELRDEVRGLQGRLEELEHSQRQKPASGETGERPREDKLTRLEDANTQLAQRMARVEEHLRLEPIPAAPKAESKIKPESSAKAPSEEEIYNRAKQAFDQGNTAQARRGFEELIQRYPNSASADNAQFWIGETFFRDKAYEKSILEYQKVIEKYPKGNKVPAALLKQGYAFLALGDKVNSRLLFEELIRKYPRSAEAKLASDKLKEIR